MKTKFDVSVTRNLTDVAMRGVRQQAQKSVKVVGQDLARTSSETTPHLTGDLSGSYTLAFENRGVRSTASVSYAVYKGGFNYAMAMHEGTYKLGEGSRRKGGGTGMSGRNYSVGRKFLTRVLTGEKDAYTEYIQEQIAKVIRSVT